MWAVFIMLKTEKALISSRFVSFRLVCFVVGMGNDMSEK
jgi:hypothetical protein